jgi:hypothetical protein
VARDIELGDGPRECEDTPAERDNVGLPGRSVRVRAACL